MKINRGKKTEVMVCSKNSENINIKMDDDALKQVTKFKYLGSIFTEDWKNKQDKIHNELKKIKLRLIIKSK
jgi:protein-arginine kinase activator protein McsA